MTPETRLANALSDSSERTEAILTTFFKTAGDPGSAVSEMKKSVDTMKKAVSNLAPKPKVAAMDKIAMVDAWARQLAREDFEKSATIGAMLTGAVNRFGPAIGRGLTAIKNSSTAKRTLVGAAGGAGLNLMRHYMKPKNPMTGQRDGSALGAAAGGAAIGAVGGLASKSIAEHALGSQPVQDAMRGQWRRRPTPTPGPMPRLAAPPIPASQQTVNAG